MTTDDPTNPAGTRRGLVGRVVGDRYAITQVVSAGANTVVVHADDRQLGRPVTIKFIRPEWAESRQFRRRFDETMQFVATLSHPNITAVYDWGEEEIGKRPTTYVVIERLEGGSLRDLFDRGRLLDPSQALVVGLDACRGLDFAHRHRLVHSELTPSKLVFGDDRRLRISDFGLARLFGIQEWRNPSNVATETARYASPEQALAQPVDPKTDVYSLALILVEAVTGSVPFAARSTVATLSARVGRLMPVSADLGPLAAVLERAGRPEPAERSTAAELGRGLVRVAETLPRPAPIPILVSSMFEDDPSKLRRPNDPTGGVNRPDDPPLAPVVPPVVVVADEPAVEQAPVDDVPVVEEVPEEPVAEEPAAPDEEPAAPAEAVESVESVESEESEEPEEPVAPAPRPVLYDAAAEADEDHEDHDGDDDDDAAPPAGGGGLAPPRPLLAPPTVPPPVLPPEPEERRDLGGRSPIGPAAIAVAGAAAAAPVMVLSRPTAPRALASTDVEVRPAVAGLAVEPQVVEALDVIEADEATAVDEVATVAAADEVTAIDEVTPRPETAEVGANSAVAEAAAAPATLYDGDVDATVDELAALAQAPTEPGPASPDPDTAGPAAATAATAAAAIAPATPPPAPPTTPPSNDAPSAERRRRRIWPWLLALFLLGALAALGYVAYRLFRTPTHEVPALVGQTEADAARQTADFDWQLDVERERSDEEPDEGDIIRTAPAAGERLAEGEPFLIVVSEGPEFRTLPELSGMTLSEAETALAELRLVALPASEEFDEEVPAGEVVSWTVPDDDALAAGGQVLPDTEVELVVSAGPEPRTIPDLAGVALSDAQAQLEDLRLVVTLGEQVFSDTVPVGGLVATDPPAGTSVERGSTVVLTQSKGVDLVTMPDLTGQTLPQIQATLASAGLNLGSLLGSTQGTYVSASVLGETAEPGMQFKRGTAVDLILL
jgi:serine/threonine-protein kinase